MADDSEQIFTDRFGGQAMRRIAAPGAVLLFAIGLCGLPRSAAADAKDSKDAARAQFELGKQHYKAEAYARAAEAFEASVLLYPTVSAYFNLANARFAAGAYDDAVRAAEGMRRYFGDAIPKIMKEKTAELLQRIDEAAALLEIRVTPEGAALFVNDRQVPQKSGTATIRLAPGTLTVRAEKPGWTAATRKETVAAGTKTALHIALAEIPVVPAPAPAPAPPPEPKKETPHEQILPPEPEGPSAPLPTAKSGRRLSAASIVSISATAVLGAATGAFAGTAEKYYNDAEGYNQSYGSLTDTSGTKAAGLRSDWSEARDRHELFKYLTFGFAAATGIAATAAAVLLVRDLRHSEKKPSDAVKISLGPDGIRGSF